MDETGFYNWLTQRFGAQTASSRLSNCRRLEEFEGSLDEHFDRNQGVELSRRLIYSKDDLKSGKPPRHRVPIKGNVYTGTSTLRSAVKLYFDFKSGPENTKSGRKTDTSRRRRSGTADWPEWAIPSDEELRELMLLTARYIQFLSPEAVRRIVGDNERNRAHWASALEAKGVNPEIYLWPGSSCAFPGVRRYMGSQEIAYFRKHTELGADGIPHAVALDDNDYPKHLWSFLLRGRPFQKVGPKGYALAHLADHKDYKNRKSAEFSIADQGAELPLFGLFTAPTNTAYVPTSLLRPTDFSPIIRKLILHRAHDLYGEFCSILPPWLNVQSLPEDWSLEQFDWPDPVGDESKISDFLEFRRKSVGAYLDR